MKSVVVYLLLYFITKITIRCSQKLWNVACKCCPTTVGLRSEFSLNNLSKIIFPLNFLQGFVVVSDQCFILRFYSHLISFKNDFNRILIFLLLLADINLFLTKVTNKRDFTVFNGWPNKSLSTFTLWVLICE